MTPSRDTIEYGRAVITELVAECRRFAEAADSLYHGERWRMYANVLEDRLLGGHGPVIAPFDLRLLDASDGAEAGQLELGLVSS